MRISLHMTDNSKGHWTLRADLDAGESIRDKEGHELNGMFPVIGTDVIREMLLMVTEDEEYKN